MFSHLKESSNFKVLVVSYAFPPLKVAMASCVTKVIAALSSKGYLIDVVCADMFPPLVRDESLLTYASISTSKVIRLKPIATEDGFWKRCKHIFFHFLLPRVFAVIKKVIPNYPHEMLSHFFHRMLNPEPMTVLEHSSTTVLTGYLLNQQRLVALSFSPFYSVNLVMLNIKAKFPELKWIAQFSDPWAQNPLEKRWVARIWAKWYEPKVVRAADFIIHNSQSSLDLMVGKYGKSLQQRSIVIPHPFDAKLYPVRPKLNNATIVIRHVGVLFDHRSPEPLFIALNSMFSRRNELRGVVTIDFVGSIEKVMLETTAAKTLPIGTIVCTPSVNYVESLEKMYDADILLLIEANTKNNLFMPSKLSDYIGAGNPIIGIVPQGPALETLVKLGGWHAHPSDIDAISQALENVIDYVRQNINKNSWRNESVSWEFSIDQVGKQYAAVFEKLAAK